MIEVRHLRKRFGATVALDDVSVRFLAGEVHCVLGENGAGKSTLGKVIGGLHPPDDGRIEVDGQLRTIPNPKAAHRLGIAVCYQELSLARDLSVRANLCLGAEAMRQPFTRIDGLRERAEAAAVLGKLGLEVDMEQTLGALSLAQQQLVEIGKTLMLRPRAIVFDEPTAMLGAVEKRQFLDVLRQLRAEGIAVILITHHIEDVMAVSDRVTIMRNGRLVESFTMAPETSAEDVVERLTGKKRDRSGATASIGAVRGASLLQIDRLRWRDRAQAPIDVHRGQIAAFYGVVGCGAEAMVAALAGQGAAGPLRFRLGGRDYRPASAAEALRAGVSYLPAGRASNCILPTRSIVENLTLSDLRRHARFGVLSRTAESRHAQTLLRDAGVKFSDASLPITSLSGGNQQKVLLARAMAAARDLLVLEEPTAGVDIDAKAQIHARIRAAAATGLAVVLLSSDLGETIALSDVVYTLYRSEVAGVYGAPGLADQPHIIADVLGQLSAREPDGRSSEKALA